MTKPYWYNLLDYWVNQKDNSGLSIPFLIGVRHEYIEAIVTSREAIKGLFNEIANALDFEYCLTIEFCRTIDAYRLGLVQRQDLVAPFISNKHGEPTLAYKQSEFSSNEMLPIITCMVTEYERLIDDGKFSKGSSAFGIWEPFTTADRLFIKKALQS